MFRLLHRLSLIFLFSPIQCWEKLLLPESKWQTTSLLAMGLMSCREAQSHLNLLGKAILEPGLPMAYTPGTRRSGAALELGMASSTPRGSFMVRHMLAAWVSDQRANE